jgi:hypothetical protein
MLVDLHVHDAYAIQGSCVVGLSACGGIKGTCIEHDCRLTLHLTKIDNVGRKETLIWVLVV